MTRRIVALAAAGCLALIPLGAASASSSTLKRIAYVSGDDLWTIAANGSGTTNLGESPNNPSISTDGQTILFDDGASVRSIGAGGPADSSSVLCAGTDPAISPDGTRVAFESGGNVVVGPLACGGASTSLGAGGDPAWSPDGTQIVFIDGSSDLVVAPSTGGAAQKLGTTSAVESGSVVVPRRRPHRLRLRQRALRDERRRLVTPAAHEQLGCRVDRGRDPDVLHTGGGRHRQASPGGRHRHEHVRRRHGDDGAEQRRRGQSPDQHGPADDLRRRHARLAAHVDGGDWSGSEPFAYTYEWRRCNATGDACSPIPGSTATSYVVTGADLGARIVVAVTARNALGSASIQSPPSDVIRQGAAPPTPATLPQSTRAPSFTGTLVRSRTLRAANGTWSGTTPTVFSYQWLRCPATGTNYTPISNATRSAYVLAAADVGRRIRLRVTAGNAAGSTQALSAISRRVTARAAASAPARGRTIHGTPRADRLIGTARADTIYGGAGNDRIQPRGGRDRVFGGAGNDTIFARDGAVDVIDCGAGAGHRLRGPQRQRPQLRSHQVLAAPYAAATSGSCARRSSSGIASSSRPRSCRNRE